MKTALTAKRLCLVCSLLLFLISGCTQTVEVKGPGVEFLTAFFTSNQDERWDTLQSADLTSQKTANTASAEYLSGLSLLCTEACLASVAQNRQLSQLDSLAEQYDCTFVPQKVTVSAPNESHVATFEIELSVQQGEDSIGTVTQQGELTFADDSALVDNIWFAGLDGISSFLEEME